MLQCLSVLILFAVVNAQEDETTCQALKRAASDAVVFNHLTHPENCSTTPGCLGIECIANLTKKRDTFSSLTLHPCTSPKSASMLMVYRDQLVLNESFTQSFVKSYLILNVVDFVLNVTFVDMNDSILIGVDSDSNFGRYTIIPIRKIPLDEDLCDNMSKPTAPPTINPPPTVPFKINTSCDGLAAIAQEAPELFTLPTFKGTEECWPFSNCTGVQCTALFDEKIFRAYLFLLSCHDPPAVRLKVVDNTDQIHLNQVVDTNTTITLYYNHIPIGVLVTIIQSPKHDYIIFGMDVNVVVFGLKIPIVSPTKIPLDVSVCACEAWDEIAADFDDLADLHLGEDDLTDTCKHRADCTGLNCTLTYGSTKYKVVMESKPCQDPPSVHLLLLSEKEPLLDHFVTKSEKVKFKVFVGVVSLELPLIITFSQGKGAVNLGLVLELSSIPLIQLNDIVLLPSSARIPMDSSHCSVAKQESVLTAAQSAGIGVGVVLLLLTICVVGAVVIAVIFFHFYKRKRGSIDLEPTLGFVSKDYTDKSKLPELDEEPTTI